MTNNFPITMLAQLGDVTVFQTAAFINTVNDATSDIAKESSDVDVATQSSQQICQIGQASYGALNLGLHVNDDATKVLDNRMRLLAAINEQLAMQQRLPINSLHWVNQVHGKQIYDSDAATLSMRPVDADALVSQQAHRGLAVMTADCVPIVLYQPTSGQIAAIHAGWQGLASGVIKDTAERFTAVGQIMAWIGVSISQAHYEVGSQVRDQLLAGCIGNKLLSAAHINNFAALFSIPVIITPKADIDTDFNTVYSAKPTDNPSNLGTVGDDQPSIDKPSFDKVNNNQLRVNKKATDKIKLNLPKLAAYQLAAVGITVDNEFPITCSYADTRYYSYRRQTHLQQPATGRMALIVVRSLPMMAIKYR